MFDFVAQMLSLTSYQLSCLAPFGVGAIVALICYLIYFGKDGL